MRTYRSLSAGGCIPMICRRKQKQVEAHLKELGMQALEERLQSAVSSPASPGYRLLQLIQRVNQEEVRAQG